MAEAITNTEHSQDWQAYSAGTKPTGYVHPKALQVLQEIDIMHTGRSKDVDNFKDQTLDMVVTVCDSAQEECPLWLGQGKIIHLGFRDPAEATGTEEEILAEFREVRDQIRERLSEVLENEIVE
jgi:arsenate reductase